MGSQALAAYRQLFRTISRSKSLYRMTLGAVRCPQQVDISKGCIVHVAFSGDPPAIGAARRELQQVFRVGQVVECATQCDEGWCRRVLTSK